MFVDARQLPDATVLEADVCIIGGGAAGMTIARELANTQARIVMLESGDFDFDPETQDLYKGENVGLAYAALDATRLRFLGGTTNHWAGWCLPFTPIDFEPKPWLKESGWPIRFEDLQPFYERACKIVELPSRRFTLAEWETVEGVGKQAKKRMPVASERFANVAFQVSPPTRFGLVYRDDLDRAESVKVYLNANVTELVTSDNGAEVVTIRAATLSGRRFTVQPKAVVLACGGIENPRLMLLSTGTERAGIGNRNDLVGRYFGDHIQQVAGYAFFAQPLTSFPMYFPEAQPEVIAALKLAPGVQRTRQTLGSVITFHPAVTTAKATDGYASLRWIKRSLEHGRLPGNIPGHIANMVVDVNAIGGFAFEKLLNAPPPANLCTVEHHIEVRPNPDSRVMLDTARDPLGLPRVKLDWRLTDTDKATIRIAQEELSLAFGESGLGRIRTVFRDDRPWPPGFEVGHHHIGTTRMSADPKTGVVDSSCRVHGMANLWIAGSSVFPTTGTSTPTLTIVALALRLAEHLKEKLT